jgi:hypothetical protein
VYQTEAEYREALADFLNGNWWPSPTSVRF